MVADADVVEILLEELLKPEYDNGYQLTSLWCAGRSSFGQCHCGRLSEDDGAGRVSKDVA
jgi:hypothetical protein